MSSEQAVRIADGGPELDARFARLGRNVAIVAPPHPMMGGSMDSPVVEAMVEGFQAGGWSTLRFNFRGVGESAGSASGNVSDAVADYQRVVKWARDQESDWLTFGGYSFGALAAIGTHLSGLDCHCIAAVAPPAQALTPEMMERIDCLFALVAAKHDQIAEPGRYMELLTHATQAAYHLIDADHFFANQRDEIFGYARTLAHDLTRAQAAERDHA